jgi:hypothetical protein
MDDVVANKEAPTGNICEYNFYIFVLLIVPNAHLLLINPNFLALFAPVNSNPSPTVADRCAPVNSPSLLQMVAPPIYRRCATFPRGRCAILTRLIYLLILFTIAANVPNFVRTASLSNFQSTFSFKNLPSADFLVFQLQFAIQSQKRRCLFFLSTPIYLIIITYDPAQIQKPRKFTPTKVLHISKEKKTKN